MKLSQVRDLKKSVIGQLSLAIISVFVAMTVLSNLLINWYQTHLTNEMLAGFQASAAEKKETLVLVDTTYIQSMWEFRTFSIGVVVVTILLGSAILYTLIKRIMKPFKDLADTVAAINSDNVMDYQKDLATVGSSREMEQLTRAFNQALGKVYQSYERERRFSNDVAHELRLPLAIMRSKIDLYQKQPTDTQAFVASMDTSLERLSHLVEGVLLFSRQNQMNLAQVALRDLLEEILFDLEEMAEQKQISLSLTGDHPILTSDDQLLARALYNLIENAIKYNVTNGSVQVYIEDQSDQIELTIRDTGIGISDEDKKRIFDLFYRVDDSRNSAIKGYGIGLSLAAKIVKQLHGDIVVEDNKPRGTVFRIILKKLS
ncbi:sensor histidine kinase [Streptococcus saliviloxodontae]|nr:HAMP domain-containing sensor histidine kinase [Streptococcus saliviloxodontae]